MRGNVLAKLFVVWVCGCSSVTGPDFGLPPEDRSLDPMRLGVGPELYYCGDWNPQVPRPTSETVFVDVYFQKPDSLLKIDHPLLEQRSRVAALGGEIVRSYNLPAFRLRVPTDSVPVLSTRENVIVRLASHLERYDLMVAAFYGPHAFGSADSSRIAALGGRVVSNFEFIGFVVLQIPNASLPEVRHDSRVTAIEPWADFLCPGLSSAH